MKRVLVLGLGNELLSDVAVGLLVVKKLREEMKGAEDVDFLDTHLSGYNLLDLILGYDVVVVVDSIVTGENPVGAVYFLSARDFECKLDSHPHSLGLPEVVKLCEAAGLEVPEVFIAAVEVRDVSTLGCSLTPEVERALPEIVERVREFVERVRRGAPS